MRSCRYKDTEKFAGGESVRRFQSFARVAYRKIKYLMAAGALEDLPVPPGNHLEALSGDRNGQHSIRINDQWRICFVWNDGGAEAVEIEFLKPMGISQYRLAKEIHVPLRRVNEIVLGRRGISADTALRFARFFGTTPEVWQNLQSQYEMDVAKGNIWSKIMKTVRPLRRSAACL